MQIVTIALWSHLFCGAWSAPGKVFGWLSALAYNHLPEWLYTPFIGCAMCHAVWVSLPFEVLDIMENGIRLENLLCILATSYGAYLLDDFQTIRENWKNN